MDRKNFLLINKALSNNTRIKIISALKDKKLCAYHLLDQLEITQPTLSHHMKILCDCGLVSFEKDWKWIYYSLNKDKVDEYIAELKSIIG